MPAILTPYLSGTATQITALAPLSFSWTSTATAEQLVDISNTGDEPATNRRLGILAKVSGSGDDPVATGIALLDRRGVKVRATVGIDGLTVAPTGYRRVGGGIEFELPPSIPAGQGVTIGIVIDPPTSTDSADLDVSFYLDGPESAELPVGTSISCGRDGILSGLADDTSSGLWAVSGDVVENPGGADDKVQLPDVSAVVLGVPVVELQQLATLNQTDGAAGTLATGEAYTALIVLGASGYATQKGTKASGGLEAAPTQTADTMLIASVRVAYGAGGSVIDDTDITNAWTASLTGFSPSNSSLTWTVSAGRARVSDALVVRTAPSDLLLEDDTAGQSVYLRRDPALSAEAFASSYRLQSGITTASGVVSVTGTDRRALTGHTPVEWHFDFTGTIAAAQYAYAAGVPYRRDVYLLPLDPVEAWLTDLPTGGGTGFAIFDIEYSDAGGSWTSIFTGSGSRDMRPACAHNTTNPFLFAKAATSSAPLPEVTVIPALARLRAKVATMSLDGTAPTGARIVLRGALS